jgi:hypothetical protein
MVSVLSQLSALKFSCQVSRAKEKEKKEKKTETD